MFTVGRFIDSFRLVILKPPLTYKIYGYLTISYFTFILKIFVYVIVNPGMVIYCFVSRRHVNIIVSTMDVSPDIIIIEHQRGELYNNIFDKLWKQNFIFLRVNTLEISYIFDIRQNLNIALKF